MCSGRDGVTTAVSVHRAMAPFLASLHVELCLVTLRQQRPYLLVQPEREKSFFFSSNIFSESLKSVFLSLTLWVSSRGLSNLLQAGGSELVPP